MARILTALLLIFSALAPAAAQVSPVPEKRGVFELDVDFFGGDLRAIFETTLEACQASCTAEGECGAFTYNSRAAACFLKTDVTRRDPYEGAVSAIMLPATPAVLARALRRADELGAFLTPDDLVAARAQSNTIGLRFVPQPGEADDLLAGARQLARAGDIRAARDLAGQAVSRADRSDIWVAFSSYSSRMPADNSNSRRMLRADALEGAVNAYLRAADGPAQVLALERLAQALEATGRGRAAIDALRRAVDIAPRDDLEAALERAIGLYGFRVVETQVDSDAANPRICLTLSEPLVEGAVDYADYLLLPQGDFPVTAEDRQLCVEGVRHGERIALTLRAGLPAKSGETLFRPVEQSFYVRDRSPSVRFLGRAYVLPKSASAAIPVVTVNAGEVEIAIHRIPGAGLRDALRAGLVGDPLNAYAEARIAGDLGEPVWSGTAEVDARLNIDVTTALPIGEAVAEFAPGIYAMTARTPDREDYEAAATQWFIVTDLGLSTLSGRDGLHVYVRGLGDAAPRADVTLTLTARNNQRLGTVTTDAEGYARLPEGLTRGSGGNAPALLTANDADGDFAFLDLTEAGLDLSDRGVEGRAAPPPVDVFLSTERGAYRPGETVFATILARDPGSSAIPGLPLTAVTLRPDGVEHDRQTLADAGAGGRAYALALPQAAQRGGWRLRVFADMQAPALAETAFLVEDFVPERIDFELALPDVALRLGETAQLAVAARYLYGAPGSGLAIEGGLRLAATDTLAEFPGYSFGPHDGFFDPIFESLPPGRVTDDAGRAVLDLALPRLDAPDRPLEATVTLRLRDASGRPVERRITRPVAPEAPLIGIRPLFDGVVAEGANAGFEIVAAGPDGAAIALPGLRWTLSRLETRYQWYEVNGRWNYEPITRRERIADGTLDASASGPVRLEAPVDWGRYELVLAAAGAGYARSSVAFSAGWYGAGAGSETPDRLEVSLDKPRYRPGETATLRLEPRAPGEILVTVLSDRLIGTRRLTAPDASALTVDLPVTEAWGPGAYVIASHIRPLDVAAGRNPSRAIGVGWVPVEPGVRALAAEFISAPQAEPRAPMEVALSVTGSVPGEPVYATIAAVDLGILNLTGFEPPDPQAHYLGQRRLGMEIRDLYGRLIDGLQGTPGRLRSGGDGAAIGAKGPPPTEDLVAFFSGVLTVGPDGIARASFDMPDFNGTVQLHAVVWSGTGVGAAAQDVLVRDPVVVTANLPRFLAPGDSATLSLELAHASGPAGDVEVSLTGTDALPLPGARRVVGLAEGGRATIEVPLRAGDVSDNRIEIVTTTPGGAVLTKSLRLAIRANDPEVARQTRFTLAPGSGLTLSADAFAGLAPGSARAVFSAGPLARFDVPGLLTSLDAYPYGCTEQITSRAMPLLYYSELAGTLGLLGQETLSERIGEAITGVLANQAQNGGFGLWNPYSEDLWLEAYATDFLSRARAQGYEVPETAFESAMRNLQNRVNAAPDFEEGGEGIAYALMVLAREGAASIGDLRYFADARADNFATPLALGQLGAALASYGDQGRADALFRQAAARFRRIGDNRGYRVDYGSKIRDRAAVLTLAVEAGSEAVDRTGFATAVSRNMNASRERSTQEKLWAVLAARALGADRALSGLFIDGRPAEGPGALSIAPADLAAPMQIRNEGAQEMPAVFTVFGAPTEPEPAQGNGYRITRALYTLQGEPADPAAIARNDRLVVLLTVTPERPSEARLMVDDPLPAGFEVENPTLVTSGEVSRLDWLELPDIARATAFQTDRFTAAVDWSGTEPFRLAYLVRAISPGDFRHPAASVEDMYRPAFRARTDAGRVRIGAAR